MKKLATITGLLALMLVVTSFTTPSSVGGGRPVGEITLSVGGGRPVGEFTSTVGGGRPVGEFTSSVGGGRPVGE